MSEPLSILFAGTPQVAVPALRLLAGDPEHFHMAAVLTRPDAPQGRGRRLAPSPVKQAAQELGIPVLESNPRDPSFPEEVKATGATCGAVVAYGRILRQPVLDALDYGWYNLHFSLLPLWRGAAPVQRALWAGDRVTGATVFRLTKGMDEGPILAQSTLEIGPRETSGELLGRLSEDGAQLLAASLQAVSEGRAQPQPQPQGAYETADKISGEDAHIRFDKPAFAVDRQIRACTPEPGAWCLLHEGEGDQGLTLHVLQARPAQADQRAPEGLGPGRLALGKRAVWVGTKSEPLELLQVKAAGKKAMKAADWARGARLSGQAFCD
ncbi:methionyl-tRNA formyltransferase [Bifidobacterium actinocoloniiforme DSM 22766]|uniref:Methionyl-tRNA formyltransferase n=1 Tax=Bifidobacterium actinocoloniiforme DSM 22766 TaxID=1437605 RepID=A0A086Z183_9BIFI|nr:methionyl-tRNA formyltransferase [Bifidobacterium actinocoloniiforme]AKV55447.1 methionyl-tRNA formyltransferase [Bifidobacterium actinocoloniiforme DSM 22766]KFI40283.1 methionyl-tRNA formyltransferase [Bifidobacterium actinocoloniiforme DSM 22766]